jgi:hypothetical protein
MTLSTSIKITQSSFSNSSALMGGAIYFDTPKDVDISTTLFENNRALSVESFAKFTSMNKNCFIESLPKWKEDQVPDRALTSVSCATFTTDDFTSIGQGGGLFFSRSTFVSLIENTFGRNVAAKDGGAIVRFTI